MWQALSLFSKNEFFEGKEHRDVIAILNDKSVPVRIFDLEDGTILCKSLVDPDEFRKLETEDDILTWRKFPESPYNGVQVCDPEVWSVLMESMETLYKPLHHHRKMFATTVVPMQEEFQGLLGKKDLTEEDKERMSYLKGRLEELAVKQKVIETVQFSISTKITELYGQYQMLQVIRW